jgi:hypothetical protein
MKRFLVVALMMLVAGLFSGCGGNGEPADNDNTVPPAPVTPPAEPPTEVPADGYPAPPPPPADAYPAANRLWIIHPAGEQCAESLIFESLDEATTDLEEAGIIVFEAEEVGLMVCEACGCPTSQHFRAQIGANDLGRAMDLGWQEE